MSTNATSSNVIPMREFEREAPTQQAVQFERLLRECRDLALSRLSKALVSMLDKLPDLNAPSTSLADRESHDLFVQAKLSAISQRVMIVDQFHIHFLAEFDAISHGRKTGGEFSKNDLSSLELSLVDESDFEETLKVNEMAAKLRRYCDEEVVALDQRMGVLIGDATLQGQANPLSPHAICNAYRQACRHIESDGKVRLVLLKLFDDWVLDEIRPIYKDLNGLLVERSILPKIRYSAARRASALGALPGMRREVAEAAEEILQAAQPAAGAAAEQDFFALLQGLMGAAPRRPGAVPGGPAASIGGFPAILGADASVQRHPGELVRSLTRIQHGDVSGIGGADVPMAAALIDPGMNNVLRELKSTSFANGMSHTEGMTLDIVIMLFDQIFDDSKIPSPMKGLIGRLQIPMLKVAILDKAFFSKKQHPARKFLDTMGELCLSVPEDFASSSLLYKELDRIVQKLIDSFQEKLDVFDELRVELEGVAARQIQQVTAQSRHLAAAVEQRERLGLAKAVAQHAIKLRVESKQVPAVVVRFLVEQWVKLLIIAYAKHGADSDAYQVASSTMDSLVWSVSPMQSLDERRKLATRLPGLLKRLDYGLQLIGTPEDVRKRFFAKLMRCHTKVMNAAPVRMPTSVAAGHCAAAPAAEAGNRDGTATAGAAQTAAALPVLTEAVEAHTSPDWAPAPDSAAEAKAEAAKASGQDDTEPQEGVATFTAVTIPNPFGDGQIEVEEIDVFELPGGSLPDLPATGDSAQRTADEHSQLVSRLEEGAWVEFRDEDDKTAPARLSYISPLKGTYLFVNRQGRKVAEYSLYQLARQFRTGQAALIDSVPLFDRAMTNLVGVLKKSA